MLVKGHSGFQVELVDASTIRKSAQGTSSPRLLRQIQKQIAFQARARWRHILTPKILREASGPESYFAEMEFIAAGDFIEFLLEAGREDMDDFLDLMEEMIRDNLAECREEDVTKAFEHKLDDLARQGVESHYVDIARKWVARGVVVPAGPCHGDLTLSNILFKKRRLYLIDFLDSFVESPLQDVVKLRQDTAHGWSLLLYQKEFDQTKIRLTLAYLDRQLVARFEKDLWYQKHYGLFQLVNLLRILPYCRETAIAEALRVQLDRLLPQLKANPA